MHTQKATTGTEIIEIKNLPGIPFGRTFGGLKCLFLTLFRRL